MITDKGKILCDAEIGRIGRWHGCNKKATVLARNLKYGIDLHFCECHEKRGNEQRRFIVRRLPC